jgi:glycosyltransferase involved in cell wall biosynthesis
VNIIVHTVCFNEALLLPHFINHYGSFASKIVIYDNNSTDNSTEIALRYPNVVVISFDTGGLFSEIALMEIRNTCWQNDDADYSIVCDVDEFLYKKDLVQFLEKNKEFGVFKPLGYDMVSDHFPSDYSRPITDQVKFGRIVSSHSKTILFQPKLLKEINFGPGSHFSEPEFKVGAEDVQKIYIAKSSPEDLKLLHYKNLGLDYRYARHRLIGQRLGGEEFRRFKFGFHYNFDFEIQEREFMDLKKNAFQVLE